MLDHLSLKVGAGDYVALVGPSGAGKTTLCSLIPRFYEVSGGNVKIDGIDVRDMKLKDLRRNIGIVQQDVYLLPERLWIISATVSRKPPSRK